jgi:hypothetical protein
VRQKGSGRNEKGTPAQLASLFVVPGVPEVPEVPEVLGSAAARTWNLEPPEPSGTPGTSRNLFRQFLTSQTDTNCHSAKKWHDFQTVRKRRQSV